VRLLTCPECAHKLESNEQLCVCPHCNAQWPVKQGIPRFFEVPTYYWGEVSRQGAQELLQEARTGSWIDAVRRRFPENDNMSLGVLDLQRASWAPMLGINDASVALDIGSGYGAITHSLARFAGEVYSVEAVPERIEFTQERLRQANIRNVRLIQASATALPLADGSFDAVVANGVLEWVGEWNLEADPRTVQLRFLEKLCRLLKDDGVLVVGIENRFGYGLFLGGKDHSGLPFTSLVPRRLATSMLRLSSRRHYRTDLNPKKQYRTYTYSRQGYEKLLFEAGFQGSSCYWADPGYNQPYHLIPVSMPRWTREHFLDLLDHPGAAPRRSWRRSLKRAVLASPFLDDILPDFVLFAAKKPVRRSKVDAWIDQTLNDSAGCSDCARDVRPWALYTRRFESDSIVRIGSRDTSSDVAYIRVHMVSPKDSRDSDFEALNRSKVEVSLRASGIGGVSVPSSIGNLRVGNTSYTMESAAKGTSLSRRVRQWGYFADAPRVETEFTHVVDRILDLSNVLQAIPDARQTDPSWYVIPKEFHHDLEPYLRIHQSRFFQDSADLGATVLQHGDLSVENLYLDDKSHTVAIIDWADLAAGLPPLYDLFELFYSTGYLTAAEEGLRFKGDDHRWVATFRAVFLNATPFSRIVQKLILHACSRLHVDPESVPSLLLEFLIVRSHYYGTRLSSFRTAQLRALELCIASNRCVFGEFYRGHDYEHATDSPTAAD
jgi:SAM-dependent methyltransferase